MKQIVLISCAILAFLTSCNGNFRMSTDFMIQAEIHEDEENEE